MIVNANTLDINDDDENENDDEGVSSVNMVGNGEYSTKEEIIMENGK